jgi:GntP family gluconate:H+ symporter
MEPPWILLIGIIVVVGGVLVLRLHAFLALILGALIVGAATPQAALDQFATGRVEKHELTQKQADKFSRQTVGERVAEEFGKTCGNIAILIAMASIVGKCLLDSGGADRIVRSALKLLGESRAGLAFLSSGFVLGIPVFFDTVFYLMIPLGKALYMRTGKNYLLYVLSITAGATMTHSLVPPTPGPLFVANELGVSLGLMILGGCVVGAFTSAFGYAFALWANKRWDIPLRTTGDVSLDELEVLSRRDESELPPLWLALLPILLPVVLIGGQAVVEFVYADVPSADRTAWQQATLSFFTVLGNKNIALLLSASIAIGTLAWQRRASRDEVAEAVQSGVGSAGTIILVTAAGGAFGGMLAHTGIAAWIQQHAPQSQTWVIPMAFLVTTLIRTAQGSSTVAMITAAGILAPLTTSGELPFDPLYVALAIGCGSKPICWMNDSGFWVICKMSGLTEAECLKTVTPLTSLMGCVGLVITMIGAWLLPVF